MSTDKLQALSDTIAGILNEPPSAATYFDPEPHDEGMAAKRVAKPTEGPAHSIDAPKGGFGKLSSREAVTSQNPAPEAHSASPLEVESAVRVAGWVNAAAGAGQPSKLGAASLQRAPQTRSVNRVHSPVSGSRIWLRRWGLLGLAGIVPAAGLGVAAVVWLGSSGEKANSQGSPATVAALAALPPELAPALQSMSRDLASLRGQIEELKLSREQSVHDNLGLVEQLKTSQDQLSRDVARLSDQVKVGQELAERDNANAAEQIRTLRDQLARLEQAAVVKKVTPPPRTAAPTLVIPAAEVHSPQGATQLTAGKPKSHSTPRPAVPTPAR